MVNREKMAVELFALQGFCIHSFKYGLKIIDGKISCTTSEQHELRSEKQEFINELKLQYRYLHILYSDMLEFAKELEYHDLDIDFPKLDFSMRIWDYDESGMTSGFWKTQNSIDDVQTKITNEIFKMLDIILNA